MQESAHTFLVEMCGNKKGCTFRTFKLNSHFENQDSCQV